jgi:predicted nuclease of predicted toxin-antitoxin system
MSATTACKLPPDAAVLQHAREHDQVLISADTDFGTLLARTGADKPSVILIRRSSPRRATELVTVLSSNLDAITDDLKSAAVVVIPTPTCASGRSRFHRDHEAAEASIQNIRHRVV